MSHASHLAAGKMEAVADPCGEGSQSMEELDQLALLHLRIALREPGCPICRIAREAATRYLQYLLREHVNHLEARIRISQSQGFCHRHAWELHQMEVKLLGGPVGNSIIYEDLVGQVARALQAAEAGPARAAERGIRRRGRAALGRRPRAEASSRPEPDLAPRRDCPACESHRQSSGFCAVNLVRMLADPEYQAMWAESDGVCLAHLCLALSLADSEAGRLYLIASTRARLVALRANLGEFARKQAWQYRTESLADEERTALQRAVAFFAGPDVADDFRQPSENHSQAV